MKDFFLDLSNQEEYNIRYRKDVMSDDTKKLIWLVVAAALSAAAVKIIQYWTSCESIVDSQ